MKVIIQRVLKAKVEINDVVHGEINKGYLLLVSFTDGDNDVIIKKMAEKVINLRIFEDENGKTNLSIKDVEGDILSISQFTLYANCQKGNRPSFIEALTPDISSGYYDLFNKYLSELGFNPKVGVFGADMKVSLINDGPFTIILDSKELFK